MNGYLAMKTLEVLGTGENDPKITNDNYMVSFSLTKLSNYVVLRPS